MKKLARIKSAKMLELTLYFVIFTNQEKKTYSKINYCLECDLVNSADSAFLLNEPASFASCCRAVLNQKLKYLADCVTEDHTPQFQLIHQENHLILRGRFVL